MTKPPYPETPLLAALRGLVQSCRATLPDYFYAYALLVAGCVAPGTPTFSESHRILTVRSSEFDSLQREAETRLADYKANHPPGALDAETREVEKARKVAELYAATAAVVDEAAETYRTAVG